MQVSGSLRSNCEPNRFKRLREEESESDFQTVIDNENISDTWPRYIVVSAIKSDQTFDKLSPFVVSKALKGIIGETNDAKILRSGKVLVKCKTRQQSVNLLKCKMFGHVPIQASPHNTLNSCKGVIRSYELRNASEQEILEDLKEENVTEVKRITITKKGEKTSTNTFILKFSVPTLPSTVKTALTVCQVEPYVPNPLRCFNCQRFGHHKDKCGKDMVCGRCGQEGHDLSSCDNPLQCANCKGEHFAYSKECPKWKQEKEIQAVKVKQNLTFQEARKLVISRTPGGSSGPSYATVTKSNTVQGQSQECSLCNLLMEKMCILFPEKEAQIKQVLKEIKSNTSENKNADSSTPKTSSNTHKTDTTSSDITLSNSSSKPSSSAKSTAVSPQTSSKEGKTASQKPQKNSNKSPKRSSNRSKSPKGKKSANSAQTKNTSEKEKQRPKINRLIAGSDSNGASLTDANISKNKFSVLEQEHMEDDDVADDDEYKGPWKDPDWNEDTSSWENSNAGD